MEEGDMAKRGKPKRKQVPNSPGAKFARWRQQLLALQKFNFTGASKFDPERKPLDTVRHIFSLCLREPIPSVDSLCEMIAIICEQHGFVRSQVIADCLEYWPSCPGVGDRVLAILQQLVGHPSSFDG